MKRLLIFLSKTEWIWKSLSISNGVLIFFCKRTFQKWQKFDALKS